MSLTLVRHHSGPWIRAGKHSKHDSFVLGENLFDDQYGLSKIRRKFQPATILDVGAHIGTAAMAFKRTWPNATIICIEPDSSSWECLEANASGFATILKMAAVVSGDKAGFLATYPSYESHLSPDAPLVDSIPLGRVISDSVGPVLLKLDCEGAEHELLRIPEIKHVAMILGEWHDEARWNDTAEFLTESGMTVGKLPGHLFSAVWP